MGAPTLLLVQQRGPRPYLAGIGALGFDLPSVPSSLPGGDWANQASQAAKDAGLPDPTQAYNDLNQKYQQALAYEAAIQNLIAHPDQLVKSITVRTTHLPPIEIVDPLKPAPPGVGSQVSHELKPAFTITFNPIASTQLKPVTYAPYGDPGESDFDTWATIGAVVGAGALAVFGIGAASWLKGRKGGLLRRWLARRKGAGSGLTGARAKRVRGRRVR